MKRVALTPKGLTTFNNIGAVREYQTMNRDMTKVQLTGNQP